MLSKPFSTVELNQSTQPRLDNVSASPVTIASIELLQVKLGILCFPLDHIGQAELYLIRSTSTDGAVGIAVAHEQIKYFYPILQELVIPYFVGKDARNLESLVDGVYTFRANYKLSGLPLWCCVAWVEFSLLDLLGKVAAKPIGELLGGVFRHQIPVYLSSLRRDTTPEKEVAAMAQRLEETGAKAAKFKIGGRMSQNADAAPGRTEKLISLARKTFDDSIEICADANGSYDAVEGIEIGRMLEAHRVSFFEEPCPFDDLEQIKQVADALSMSVAAGEQETSFPRFKRMMQHRVVDLLQPDITYNGGFIRTLRVARIAAALNVPIAIHNARLGFDPVYTLHFSSCVPTQYQEFNARPHKPEAWFTPKLEIQNGLLQVPREPGLGIKIDPGVIRKARRL